MNPVLRCRIADLITEVPSAGGLASRCGEYLYDGDGAAEIVIREESYRKDHYPPRASESAVAYMESAYQFCFELVKHEGLYLHASAVEVDGKAYLFSGNSGVGKSTHTGLWLDKFGDRAQVFNDDKPALRRLDDRWYAYGTPWCGKDGINANRKVPLAGICFLKQAPENQIRRLTEKEALTRIVPQTMHKTLPPEGMYLMLEHLDKLIREIPVYELENRPEPEAAHLSYETMLRGAKEKQL